MGKKDIDLIIFSGAPGSGKSTICELLRDKLESPMIDFGKLREFHLDRKWKKESEREREMTFDNLVFMLRNYIKKGYKNVIINDIGDNHALDLMKLFSKNKCLLITLVVEDKVLEKRIIKRNSGFKNTKQAIIWNKELRARRPIKHEIVIDNTHNSPQKAVDFVIKIMEKYE